ncbi:hypothetical protein H0H87_005735 [Tephrocybe sp. NHM501043]|nr:hypothetical protein H0H87_005735 [Tephrocybe sp. NHM501043]
MSFYPSWGPTGGQDRDNHEFNNNHFDVEPEPYTTQRNNESSDSSSDDDDDKQHGRAAAIFNAAATFGLDHLNIKGPKRHTTKQSSKSADISAKNKKAGERPSKAGAAFNAATSV